MAKIISVKGIKRKRHNRQQGSGKQEKDIMGRRNDGKYKKRKGLQYVAEEIPVTKNR